MLAKPGLFVYHFSGMSALALLANEMGWFWFASHLTNGLKWMKKS